GNGQRFVAEQLRRGPVQTKINVLHNHVGGYEHIGCRILRKHGAIVADLIEPELFLNVLDEVEFRSHYINVDTTIVNTYNITVLRIRHFNTARSSLWPNQQ